jgi:hypothetical protein
VTSQGPPPDPWPQQPQQWQQPGVGYPVPPPNAEWPAPQRQLPPEAYQYTQPPQVAQPLRQFVSRSTLKKKRPIGTWLIPTGIGVAALLIGVAIGASGKSSTQKTSNANALSAITRTATATATRTIATTATVTVTTTSIASAPVAKTTVAAKTTVRTPVVAAQPPVAGARSVLSLSGSGIKSSANFIVTHDQWTIGYTYNCASFGSTGNFQIYVYGSDGSPTDVAANELGTGLTDSTTEHGTGTYYLQINSECSWQVTVTG